MYSMSISSEMPVLSRNTHNFGESVAHLPSLTLKGN